MGRCHKGEKQGSKEDGNDKGGEGQVHRWNTGQRGKAWHVRVVIDSQCEHGRHRGHCQVGKSEYGGKVETWHARYFWKVRDKLVPELS